jgi:hypothetical protein
MVFGVTKVNHRILSERVSRVDHRILFRRLSEINRWDLGRHLSRTLSRTLLEILQVKKRTPDVDGCRKDDTNVNRIFAMRKKEVRNLR